MHGHGRVSWYMKRVLPCVIYVSPVVPTKEANVRIQPILPSPCQLCTLSPDRREFKLVPSCHRPARLFNPLTISLFPHLILFLSTCFQLTHTLIYIEIPLRKNTILNNRRERERVSHL